MWRGLVGAALALSVLGVAVLVPEHNAVAQSQQEAVMSKKPLPKPTVPRVPIPTQKSNPADGTGGLNFPTPQGQDVNQGHNRLQTQTPMQTWTPPKKQFGRGANLPPANIPQQNNVFTPREQQYYKKLQGDTTPPGQQRLTDFLNQYWYQNA